MGEFHRAECRGNEGKLSELCFISKVIFGMVLGGSGDLFLGEVDLAFATSDKTFSDGCG